MSIRKIIHIDMDCFYAAIEMRDNPSLADKPIAVGGSIEQRGVLSTCNYMARKFGLHSAMPTYKAFKLCPKLVLVPVNMPLYIEVSRQIQQIFARYTNIIEPISLDEAYLDVTDANKCSSSATLIANEIRYSIQQELNLTASAGIAPLKFLAKIASEQNKPNGSFTIAPDEVDDFLLQLPVSKLPGIGKVSAQILANAGLHTCADVRNSDLITLINKFGKMGQKIWLFSHGQDNHPVSPDKVRKSVAVENTLLHDIDDINQAYIIIDELYAKLIYRLQRKMDLDKTTKIKLGIKLKFNDFKQTTLEKTMHSLTKDDFYHLLAEIWQRANGRKIRLIGLVVGLPDPKVQQLNLW